MMFGSWGNPDHAACIRIIHRALDAGINFIDTANGYSDGEAEWEKRFAAWEIVEALWISESHGWERFISLQPPYSMLRRVMELEHFPMCQRFGLGTIVWSPLEGGWLTGKYRRGTQNPLDS